MRPLDTATRPATQFSNVHIGTICLTGGTQHSREAAFFGWLVRCSMRVLVVNTNALAVQNSDVQFFLQENNVVLNVLRLPTVWKQEVRTCVHQKSTVFLQKSPTYQQKIAAYPETASVSISVHWVRGGEAH